MQDRTSDVVARLRAPGKRYPPQILDGLDLEQFETICRSATGVAYDLKFLDVDEGLKQAWYRAGVCGLRSAQPMKVLDIGPGAGCFLHVCNVLGHDPIGLDRPLKNHWPDVCSWFGVNVVYHKIKPFRPLPALGRFDIVTGFYVPFNYVAKERRVWTLEEWSFFLDDLLANVLAPNGKVVFKLRGDRSGIKETEEYAREFEMFCESRGGVKGNFLIFDPLR